MVAVTATLTLGMASGVGATTKHKAKPKSQPNSMQHPEPFGQTATVAGGWKIKVLSVHPDAAGDPDNSTPTAGYPLEIFSLPATRTASSPQQAPSTSLGVELVGASKALRSVSSIPSASAIRRQVTAPTTTPSSRAERSPMAGVSRSRRPTPRTSRWRCTRTAPTPRSTPGSRLRRRRTVRTLGGTMGCGMRRLAVSAVMACAVVVPVLLNASPSMAAPPKGAPKAKVAECEKAIANKAKMTLSQVGACVWFEVGPHMPGSRRAPIRPTSG